MKKFNRIIMVLMVVIIAGLFVAPVLAVADPSPITSTIPSTVGDESIGSVDSAVGKAWNTIKLILQILAIAAIVFAGVRYMFASADQKADIKKSMGILAVGAALVFGATLIIDFITTVTSQITTT